MKISVFGTGYVGLVTGVCFAEMGNDVSCVDIDGAKIEKLKLGISPIYEPGLESLIKENLKSKRIEFTTDIERAVSSSEILFIAVGTPSDVDGSADLSFVFEVAKSIGSFMKEKKVIVNKSTVPVGTARKVKEIISGILAERGLDLNFDVVSNPEFLREGCAIEDALKPARVVVGCETELAKDMMRRLYEPFLKNGNPLLIMDPASSEMTKYAANSMLAAKISLMNEFSRVCEKLGADIENVRRGIGSDPRIGPHFIFAGVGYGGSCFPKDVRALIKVGELQNEKLSILEAVEEANIKQRSNFVGKILSRIESVLAVDRTVAVWGVAFKPGTDDIRDAPALDIIQSLLDRGLKVQVYDPVAAENCEKYFKQEARLHFFEDQYDCVKGALALIIVTEWKSFREPNFSRILQEMSQPIVFDGRNIYNPSDIRQLGFEYHSVGRPS